MLSPFPSGRILLADDLDLRESCLEDSLENNVELTLVMSIWKTYTNISINDYCSGPSKCQNGNHPTSINFLSTTSSLPFLKET